MKHVISALVENEFGVLTRIAGLFSGRGYNIESLTVAPTLDPNLSKMTLVTIGDEAKLEQINKQLNKLINVIKVTDFYEENPIHRILALIKVNVNQRTRMEVLKVIELLKGEILDADAKSCIAEFRGDEDKIKSALNLLKPFGIIDFVQTGEVAMPSTK